jgi:DNA-binding NarL/FixJ family response regulator
MTQKEQMGKDRGDPIRVLLVDDHEHVLWGLKKLIDGEWPRMMVIGTAKSISEASAAMQERKPDVVVMDICVGGEAAVDAIRALPSLSRCEVIVHTASRDDAMRRRAMLAGAKSVIDKEGPADTLLREIVRVYRERRAAAAS